MLAEAELWKAAVQWDLAFCDPRLEQRFEHRFTRSLGLADNIHCVLLLVVTLFGIARMLLSGVHRSNMEALLAPCKPPLSCLNMYRLCASIAAVYTVGHQGCACMVAVQSRARA